MRKRNNIFYRFLTKKGDVYTIKARQEKIRSRAWFKLDFIQKKFKLFHPGNRILDLGSYPGGWSQYVQDKIQPHGKVFAVDKVLMQPIQGVQFIQVSILDKKNFYSKLRFLGEKKVNCVISDASPNITGINVIDISNVLFLTNRVIEICKFLLKYQGNLVLKVFQGSGYQSFVEKIRFFFNEVYTVKPHASRSHSRESYIVAIGFRNKNHNFYK